MNRNKLKAYAPQARRDFIKAVTDRAAYYGLMKDKTEPITEQGDVAIIVGKPFPRSIAAKRKRLEERIRRQGFEQVMEAMAYTWFNRFVAIRFMELHGYLDHGYRVLSTTNHTNDTNERRCISRSCNDSWLPEILEYGEHVDLPGVDQDKVVELKLAGNKDEELYRMLLIAQCNALHKAMPFLFERVDDETELLLPENLLHSDSVIRKLFKEIPEEDWQEVEIIGWMYQFYISEKKDQVIGKVVKSEDIPAATQLFTPNWIVKYMVQNTLGRQWMATYPHSSLKEKMEFYIEPAEQTPEVHEQLKAITPENFNPEELTLLDPACGSGHILVEAYELLKAIYQERGYRKKDIPRLILEKNLYGLEIDDRSAQLAAFALMMKARADDRHIFENGVRPHVLSIQESKGLDAGKMTEALNEPILKVELLPREFLFEEMEEERAPLFSRKNLSVKGDIRQADVAQLIDLFEHGKTFGSLIRVPEKLAEKLHAIAGRVEDVLTYGEMFGQAAARSLMPLIEQAKILARKYDAVVANPPFIGARYMNAHLKALGHNKYTHADSDAFAMFVQRSYELNAQYGYMGFVTPFVWMFISSYKDFRQVVETESTLTSLIQLEYNAFEPACVPVCTFILLNAGIGKYKGDFIKLSDFKGHENQAPKVIEAIIDPNCGWRYTASGDDFAKVPGNPVGYWASNTLRNAFVKGKSLGEVADIRQGMATADNDRFLRRWFEVSYDRIGLGLRDEEAALESDKKWFPYNKGGEFRRWYGNNEFVVNWENDGYEIRNFFDEKGKLRSRPQNLHYFFKPSLTWSFISSSFFAVRQSGEGFLFDVAGSSAFPPPDKLDLLTGFLCSSVAFDCMKLLNPTMNFQVGNVASLPFLESEINSVRDDVEEVVRSAIDFARKDWDMLETSWDFPMCPLLPCNMKTKSVEEAFQRFESKLLARRDRMKQLEELNSRLFLHAYGLNERSRPEVADEQITLARPNREEDIKRLISYAMGCMLGRYSLDKPGLIYAHSGNVDFDPSQYRTFPADQDGIIPITDTDWFVDDAGNRFIEFMTVAWPREHLEKNLTFIAESLCSNRGESHRETIRRYLAAGFYKHHLSIYKKRPIYWLFSSGKQRAFQCLVYLHRYNEGTLSRMRTEYVIPLQGKINARIDQLRADINAAASSTSHRKKLGKERDKLVKQQAELQTFDEKLRHYADKRIRLDLDDGVKVNYGKFDDLLAEVKAVTGRQAD